MPTEVRVDQELIEQIFTSFAGLLISNVRKMRLLENRIFTPILYASDGLEALETKIIDILAFQYDIVIMV